MARDQPGLRACYGVVTFGRDNPDIRLMRVASKARRLPFYHDRTNRMPYCPAEVDQCQMAAFVVPGDLLLVGPAMEDFACAAYRSPAARRVNDRLRETIGFVPLSGLEPVPAATPKPADWTGTWFRAAEARITIGPEAAGKLTISGQASYGAHDPERARRGAVNVGELDGIVALPTGAMIALGEGHDGTAPFGDDRSECRARLRLFGPYLVVEDNGGCGGNNVSFTGVYRRHDQP
jgi:hypothetical protein